MQAFFAIFFQCPSHPVWNAARLGMLTCFALARPFSFWLLADRDRPRLNTIWPPHRPLDLGLWPRNLSAVIAEPRIELHQRVRSVFLMLGHGRQRSSYRIGNSITNVAPLSRPLLCAEIVPPCISII